MRVSSGQIFESGTLGIQRNQFNLYRLQNQLSTGRKILSPEDDPVAAAQALSVSQSIGLEAQYKDNQGNARSQLNLVEGNLSSLTDLVQSVRERVVQAGNTILTDAQRGFIAQEIQSRLNELVGLSNATDGVGQYLFSGYQGETRPFAIAGGAAVPPAVEAPYAYYGDAGERLLQVSSSRQLATNVSGQDLLVAIRQGNGTFVTGVGGNPANVPSGTNLGTGVIDTGSVTDNASWQSALVANGGYTINFVDNAGTLEYQVAGTLTGVLVQQPFVPGQAIQIPGAGAQVVVTGQPVAGDTFNVNASTDQSLFTTMQNLIGLLKTPVGGTTFSNSEFTNRLSAELTNIDRSLDNISRVRSDIGTRLSELDSLTSASEDQEVQQKGALSDLQDLDYTAAISDFTLKQTQLEAAQKSFAQVSRLSLFDIL